MEILNRLGDQAFFIQIHLPFGRLDHGVIIPQVRSQHILNGQEFLFVLGKGGPGFKDPLSLLLFIKERDIDLGRKAPHVFKGPLSFKKIGPQGEIRVILLFGHPDLGLSPFEHFLL